MIVRLKSVMMVEPLRIPGGHTSESYFPADRYESIRLDTDTALVCIRGKDGSERWAPLARVRELEPAAREEQPQKR